MIGNGERRSSRSGDRVLGLVGGFARCDDFGRLLRAIADGAWTVEDARELKRWESSHGN